MRTSSRRSFLRTSLAGAAGTVLMSGISPARLIGAIPPARRIQVAQIGCGRMGRADMAATLREPLARIVAVCDVDSRRLAAGQALAAEYYREQGESRVAIRAVRDYRDLLASPEIDAVIISTPDHWHALPAIEAALAGKHVYLQKPVTYSIAEAIAVRKAVEARKIILQTGSQQRSERPWRSFRTASEAVRNGRIGPLKTIRIGLGLDQPSRHKPAPMPVPDNLDYDRWLGPAPEQPYMEGRVHPQDEIEGRPGWITTEDFGLGMITNWGAHHVDIAQWAMGQELGGPVAVEARADFPADDLVTVHTAYQVELTYPGRVRVLLDSAFPMGIRFEGDDGWVFCTRGQESGDSGPPLRASDKAVLSPLPGDAVRWMPSRSHYGNWLESIAANRQPIAPVGQAVRSLQACCAAWIAMKLRRRLAWNARAERFVDDVAADSLLARPSRRPDFDCDAALRRAGLA